jgi:hypothetical protein
MTPASFARLDGSSAHGDAPTEFPRPVVTMPGVGTGSKIPASAGMTVLNKDTAKKTSHHP